MCYQFCYQVPVRVAGNVDGTSSRNQEGVGRRGKESAEGRTWSGTGQHLVS